MKTMSINNAASNASSSSFTIRKGVPLPETARRGGGVAKYPWEAMNPGDMFFVPGAKIETFYTLTSTAKKKYRKAFKAAKLTEEGVAGVGVWCLEA
jgi:hypothetical protein